MVVKSIKAPRKVQITAEHIKECLKQTPLGTEYCDMGVQSIKAEYAIKVGKNFSLDLDIDEIPYGGTFREEIKGIQFNDVVSIILKREKTTK